MPLPSGNNQIYQEWSEMLSAVTAAQASRPAPFQAHPAPAGTLNDVLDPLRNLIETQIPTDQQQTWRTFLNLPTKQTFCTYQIDTYSSGADGAGWVLTASIRALGNTYYRSHAIGPLNNRYTTPDFDIGA